MRLLIATPLYPPEIGGPATYAKALFEGLPARGVEVEVVKFSEVRHLPRLIRHYAYYRRVRKAARTADVILALDPVSVGLPAMRAAKELAKPFVVKIVGDYAWEQGRQRFGITAELDEFVATKGVPSRVAMLRKVETRVAQAAARVIVPSEYLKKIVMAWGLPSEKISVIYNAVPLEAPGVVPRAVASLPRPLYASVGRLVPWKGFEGVIEAARKNGASLAIVGDGPLRGALETHAARELPGRHSFTGALSHADTLAVMKSADAFILNSSYEGLSHVLVEAVMLGAPIYATNAGGNSEVIASGLVPVGDTAALAHALKEGKKGTPVDASRFAEPTMLEKTQALFASLI